MRILSILMLFMISGCFSSDKESNPKTIVVDYELVKAENQKALLVLFPCFPCDAENTKTEFKIFEVAIKNNISVLMMNFNQHLYLEKEEKEKLANELNSILEQENLKTDNVFIGGFSSGGNVSFLLSNYLIQDKNKIQPKGVFLVDSPIDLLELYKTSQKNIEKNVSAESLEESKWIVSEFNKIFGEPSKGISKYEENSPFTFQSKSIQNISSLKDVKLRLYTEPDTIWWKENRANEYEDLNAYSIEKLSEELKKQNFKKTELIKTTNKGYRSNGNRHPHSWSIVDANDLVKWILEE
ncbi:hypothetical protein [Flavobacterium orientale]|uniref:Uncharacterized protein n=1 Tax=Flavobacterium orientale TaxID=1756020 RepID=A0A916XZA6_9FLAO|nr:hypothetical protein [Flavobacterium orientale]GGD23197.1 hypothetical protein GCM10011343_11730 [Flavobacterium orientale]